MLKKYRIYHILRNAGIIYTRSECLALLKNKGVMISGKIISSPDFFVNSKDVVIVNNERIAINIPEKVYILLHKPVGYTCHRVSDNDKPSVMSLIELPDFIKRTIFPVGRLDLLSSGLLILTNNGSFAAKLLHFGIEKEYEGVISGYLSDKVISSLEKGVSIFLEKDKRKSNSNKLYVTQPCRIVVLNRSSFNSKVLITLNEGKKRQIRKMFVAVGFSLISLKRIRVGHYSLGRLKEKKWKFFSPDQ